MTHNENTEEEFSFKQYFIPLTTVKAIHWIVIIGLIVFFNGLFNNFVGDDHAQVVENLTIQSFQNFFAFFSGSTFYNGGVQQLAGNYYKPLLNTSFSLTYALFGLNSFAFHLLQVLLYIVNACFVFLVFSQFFRKSLAFFLALVFLVHPINSETALYISDTQEVLFFFFGIISLWILLICQSKKAHILASLCLFFSLLSKESGALFLCISILYIFIFKKKHFYLWLIYSSVLVGIYLVLRVHAVGVFANIVANAPIGKINILGRIQNIPSIFFFYIKTFVFPRDLAVSWQWIYTQFDFIHFFLPLMVDSVLLLIISSFAFIIYKKFSHKIFKVYSFFTLWFLLGIIFHLQIIPLDATAAERWFYFPIVGILGMTGLLLEVFNVNLRNKWLLLSAVTILIILATITTMRSFNFKDDLTLANHDIKVSKEAWNLESELSNAYLVNGQYKAANIHAIKSVQLFPSMNNYINLGSTYYYLGDYKQAKEAQLKSLQLGESYLSYENLAGLALVYGDSNKNIDFIKNVALRKFPQDATLWLDVAVLEYMHGNKYNARTEIEQAYSFNQGSIVSFIYNVIANNKPLKQKIINGEASYFIGP